MKPSVALTIAAAAAALFGALLIFAPAQMLQGFGLQAPDEGIVLSRDVGATLLGFAVLNWLAREATGKTLRGILIGNLAVQVLEIAVNGYEIAVGTLPAKAAPGMVIHLALGLVFVLALRKAGSRAAV